MFMLVFIMGVAIILIVLWDAFETVVFPRRVTRRIRLVRLFYRTSWRLWRATARAVSKGKQQENLLSYFGPLSLPLLLGFWAFMLIFGFTLLYWAPAHSLKTPEGTVSFGACLYFSGTTFFTLGLGDIVPLTSTSRALIVLEAGMGFAFLAIVISYLPALNQSFSRREVNISLLDARAGSPPTAAEMLRRHTQGNAMEALTQLLREWERWSAELLESHLSYPVLVYFRSQHDNQSWLAALTSILDTSAFVITSLEGECTRQAQLTFAMARHAIVDLALVLRTPPREPDRDRLPPADLDAIRSLLSSEGLKLRKGTEADEKLKELRRTYEPYVYSLSQRLLLSVPPWILGASGTDNWQISAWGKSSAFRRAAQSKRRDEGHF
ncbi:MAG TPA: potassium channel family protein [Nitrospirota bacterium]|nr:potassium channel family protein [Nitrospirota bacterium]